MEWVKKLGCTTGIEGEAEVHVQCRVDGGIAEAMEFNREIIQLF